MAKHKRAESKTHQRKVQRVARQLVKEGWRVSAAYVRGYDPPDKVSGKVPDIVATKHGHTKIIEIETADTLASHRDQLKTFTRHAAQKRGTTFEVIVTKPRKSPRRRTSKKSRK